MERKKLYKVYTLRNDGEIKTYSVVASCVENAISKLRDKNVTNEITSILLADNNDVIP